MTIEEILTAKEGEHFEFKTAERRFSYTELQKYASALSNEGGLRGSSEYAARIRLRGRRRIAQSDIGASKVA